MKISAIFLTAGIIELVSRLIYALVLIESFDKIKLLSITMVGLGLALSILCLPALAQLTNYTEILVWTGVACYNTFSAGWSGLIFSLLYKIIDPKDFAVGSGMHIFVTGNANSLGPVISGLIVDGIRDVESDFNNFNGTHPMYNPYEDPYWAPVLVGSLGLIIPAGFVVLFLKKN